MQKLTPSYPVPPHQPGNAMPIMQDDTLENHLKSLACQKPDYELLYSIWILNKKNLTQGLSIISTFFPHFSQHDFSHTLSLINNIECFLGEQRINQLGATDTFLLLMGALTHDVGMILTHHIIEKKWKEEEFSAWLQQLPSDSDKDLAHAARTLLQHHQGSADAPTPGNFSWALEVRHAVTIITAEFFRRGHARLGEENILTNQQFRALAQNFHASQLPKRFMELLGKIASLHGEDFEQVMTQLAHTANGYKHDLIHPRFIACMIRLGDLLDVDSGRFNDYALATLNRVPDSSELHHQKHAAVRHLLISPGAIEVELDCPDERVYRLARNWFDWQEEEVAHQNREWTQIAPKHLDGLPPVIQRGGIRILYKGFQPRPELMNLRFEMPREKIFQMLQGGGIYKEPGLVFIREIVQNAMDASKIQMWTDIRNGGFCGKLKREDIQFPHDLQDIYPHYPVTLRVRWKDAARSALLIECEDRGTGISEATLIRMTQRVGESHRKDPGYDALYKEMPYWLKPTAAFGVGLQSIFFVASTFEVETHYTGEESKRIIFRNSAENQYCSLEKGDPELLRGTRVKIEIPREKFRELITPDSSIQNSINFFSDEADEPYLATLDQFVHKTFASIENLRFCYETVNPKLCLNTGNQQQDETWAPLCPKYQYSLLRRKDVLIFNIREKEIGSNLKLWFLSQRGLFAEQQKLRIRDVSIDNATCDADIPSHLYCSWNLNCQESDRIVDISRDKLTRKGKQWLEQTLHKTLLPNILPHLHQIFIEELNKNENHVRLLQIQYLFYCQILRAYHIPLPDTPMLAKIRMPKQWLSRGGESISALEFFYAPQLYFVKRMPLRRHGTPIKEEERHNISSACRRKILVWDDWSLSPALKSDYTCTKILRDRDEIQILKLERLPKGTVRFVACRDKQYLRTFRRVVHRSNPRSIIYALREYPRLAVRQEGLGNRCHFPDYAACGILNPFASVSEIYELQKALAKQTEETRLDFIRNKIHDYVPPRMVEAIRKHSVNSPASAEEIEEDYIRLINDLLKVLPQVEELYDESEL